MSTTTSRSSRGGAAPTRQQLDELDALLQRMLDLPVEPAAPPPRPAPRPARPAPRIEVARPTPKPAPRPAEPPRSYPSSYIVVEDASLPPAEPPPPETVPADPVQEQAQARLRDEPTGWPPFESSWQPSAQTWGPLAETWRQTNPTPASPEMPAYAPPPPPAPAFIPPAPFAPPVHAPPGTPSVWTQTVVISDTPSNPEAPAAAPSPPPPAAPATPMWLWPLVAFNTCFDVPLLALGPVGRWLRGPTGGGVFVAVGLLALLGAAVVAVLDGIGWNW